MSDSMSLPQQHSNKATRVPMRVMCLSAKMIDNGNLAGPLNADVSASNRFTVQTECTRELANRARVYYKNTKVFGRGKSELSDKNRI